MNPHEDEFIRSLGPGFFQSWLLDLRDQYHQFHVSMREHESEERRCLELRNESMARFRKVLEYAGYAPENANRPRRAGGEAMNPHEDEFIRSLGPGFFQSWLLDLRNQYHQFHVSMREHESEERRCLELRNESMARFRKVLEYAGYAPENANRPRRAGGEAVTPADKQDYEHERIVLDESLKWIHPEDATKAAIAWLQRGGSIPEPERARIHALTRKFSISDGELTVALQKITDRPDVLAFVLDLADRYEERRRYAPK